MIIYHLLFVILIVMVVKADCLIVTYRAVLRLRTTTVLVLSLLNAVRKTLITLQKITTFTFLYLGNTTPGPGNSSGNSIASYAYGVIVAGLLVLIIVATLIISIIFILKRKYSTRRLQQVTMAIAPQATVVRYSAYPSISHHAPQLSTSEETTITSSVPQHAAYGPFYYDTEHAAVGSTTNPSVLRSAVKTNTSPSDYPDPPPYDTFYCRDECTPDKSTNNQSTLHGSISSAPPPSYASVVSTSATVPVPPATNI